MGHFEGRVGAVTGAVAGTGRALACRFAGGETVAATVGLRQALRGRP